MVYPLEKTEGKEVRMGGNGVRIICAVYKEAVELKDVDIHEDEVVVEWEDGHKQKWYSREKAWQIINKNYRLIKRVR